MTDPSNNPYAFPLPPCTAHTFQWEDGERDECYRCGATRPEPEAAPVDEMSAELHRLGLPATVNSILTEARRRGIVPSEFLRQYPIAGAL